MKHLSEEELYALTQAPDGHLHEHLRHCAECAAVFRQIGQVLEISAAAPVPEPAPDFAGRVWAAIQPSLPVYGEQERAPVPRGETPAFLSWWRMGRWAAAGALACVALLAVAFWAGRLWEQRQRPPSVAATQHGGVAGRVVFVVVRDHLDRSERLLMELDHAGHLTTIDRAPLAREASDLLEDNRLYRQTASASSDPALAALLDRLGRVLVEVAHDPSTLEGEGSARSREQMNLDGLLFELRVLRARQSAKETKL